LLLVVVLTLPLRRVTVAAQVWTLEGRGDVVAWVSICEQEEQACSTSEGASVAHVCITKKRDRQQFPGWVG